MLTRRCTRAVLVAYAIAAVACGGRPLSEPGEPITLVFKHAKHPESDALGDLIAEFEAAHPHIRVREEILPASSDDQHQFYVINLAADADDFDVIDIDIIWVPEFARAGRLRPLSPYIDESVLNDLLRSALAADWFGTELYAVPWFVDAGVLYYRNDLLAKYGLQPPRTFETLLAQAKIILEAERDDQLVGFVWQGMQYEGLVCTALEFIRGNGGAVLGATGPALTEPDTVEALRWMAALIHEHEVTPATVTTMTEEPARRVFQSGRAIFMRNWPYAWPLLRGEGSAVADAVGVTTLPSFDGHASVPTLGGYHLGINAHSPYPEEAAQFVRFMVRETSQKKILLRMGRLPAHRAVYDDADVRAALPYLEDVLPTLDRARPRPVTPYYLMISQVLQSELSAVVTGLRQPDDAMALAARQIDRLMMSTRAE